MTAPERPKPDPEPQVPPEVPETDPPLDDDDGDGTSEDDEDPDDAASGTNTARLPPLTAAVGIDPLSVWPHAPAVVGEVYGFFDDNHHCNMISMRMETWQQVFGDITTLRERNQQLTIENIEFRQGRAPDNVPRILRPNGFFRRLVS